MTLMQVLEQSNVDYLKPPREASHFGLRLWNHHPCSESWSLLIKHAKNTVLKLAQLGEQTRTPEVINFLNAKREKSLVSETTSLKLFRQAQQNSVAFA